MFTCATFSTKNSDYTQSIKVTKELDISNVYEDTIFNESLH